MKKIIVPRKITKSLFKNGWNKILRRFPYLPNNIFIWSDQTYNKDVSDRFNGNRVAIYNKSVEPARKKVKIWFTVYLECYILVKTGCQWRMLSLDFPKWQLVYYYYRKWASPLNFDLLLEKLRGHVRVKRGQSMEPSVGIMDSQSVKWGNNASLNGVDGNKKKT